MKALLTLTLAGTLAFSLVHLSASAISRTKPNAEISHQSAVIISTHKQTNKVTKKPKLAETGNNVDDGDSAEPINLKYTGIIYGSLNIKYQVMDIYLPNKSKGPFPVIIYIHGGGFRSKPGSPAVSGHIINMAKHDGYAVACVNYRGSGQAKFPAAVNDCKAAVRFLKANAAEYRLNPKKIAAWGESAGGNLVSMLGTTENIHYMDGDDLENSEYSSGVQAVVDWYGPIEFLKTDEQFAEAGIMSPAGLTNSPTSNASRYLGYMITDDVYFTQLAAPSFYIPTMTAKTAPSFFIEHGTADRMVPVQQSKEFATKLKKALGNNKVVLTLLNNVGHNAACFYQKNNINKVLTFLDGVFKKKTYY